MAYKSLFGQALINSINLPACDGMVQAMLCGNESYLFSRAPVPPPQRGSPAMAGELEHTESTEEIIFDLIR